EADSESVRQSEYLCAPDLDLALGRAFYRAGMRFTGRKPLWGILTGVRPAKLFMGLTSESSREKAEQVFIDDYYVSEKKTRLCALVGDNRTKSGAVSKNDECSLYISIPYCPSRCAYCSFVSQDNDHYDQKQIEQYLKLLHLEIKQTCAYIKNAGQRIITIYVGGGTPAILSPVQLSELTETLVQNAPGYHELTVELGRPDAITAEKLSALHNICNARISINPQTMHDPVLERIGRKHTVKQFYRAYENAVKAGFTDINVDLIAGLPGDTEDGFIESVMGIQALSPANITIHSYAKKRGSKLAQEGGADELIQSGTVEHGLDHCAHILLNRDYSPYYLYRQRDISGGGENVGWCKEDSFGLYNIYMMDELHSIYGCGAGSVTKAVRAQNDLIRFFNQRLPLEYIKHFDEMCVKKKEFIEREAVREQ
ncbi:MAG TPA: coproporphyrinogen dehydrogenase HemZ, partial [Clostridiales bacterium]|nr:coproporphyrinogen dehydrogenase HemZ [Clostridiales bacterium]